MRTDDGNKALPFEVTRGFTAMPNAVSDFYVRHPRFTPTTERVYRYLIQRYNRRFGYAWPSYSAIRRDVNIGSNETISRAIDSLEYLRLIERFTHVNDGDWDNNGYRFIPPIEDEDEFYSVFGDELPSKYEREEVGKGITEVVR